MNGYKKQNDLEIFNYINNLNIKGIHLYLEDNSLKYKARKGALSEEVLEEIKTNKEQILNFLKLRKNNSVNLSPLQLAYMAGQSKEQVLNKVNAHYYIEYSKDYIDISRLEKAVNTLIRQNDTLRLIILSIGEGLILNDVPEYKIQTYELVKLNDKLNIRESLSHRLYSYDSWPMFSLVVGKSEDFDDVLHFSFDCSILDAWCAGEFMAKLFMIYSGEEVKQPKYTYKEYINELDDFKDKNAKILQRADKYWEERAVNISNSPDLEYKQNFKDLETTTFVRQDYTFDRQVVVGLERYSKENKVTLTSVVMTVYMRILSKLSTNKNVTINITMFGKLPLNKEVNEVLGEFTNIGLIEYKDEHDNFLEAIKDTQRQIFKLLEFRAYDGVNILNKTKQVNSENTKIFPIVMTCMIGEKYKSISYGFKEEYSLSQTPQVTLDHHVRLIDGKLKLSFDYVNELIGSDNVNKLINWYKCYIDEIRNTKFK